MDKKVFDELEKINGNKKDDKEESLFPEHEFLSTCLRMGLRIEDLKILTYVDILKVLISFIGRNKEKESVIQNGIRQATQEDIQKLVARM